MALKIVGCLLMSIMRRRYVTITAVCVHVEMHAHNACIGERCLTLKIVGCLSMSTIGNVV